MLALYYVAWLCFGKVMACHGKLWRWIPFLQSVGYRRGALWKHLIVVPLSSVRGRCHYIQSQSSYRRFWRRWWWYKHVDASLVSSCMRQLCFCPCLISGGDRRGSGAPQQVQLKDHQTAFGSDLGSVAPENNSLLFTALNPEALCCQMKCYVTFRVLATENLS